MKKINLFLGVIALIALAGCLMFACSDGSSSGSDSDSFINGWEGQGGNNSGRGGGGPPTITSTITMSAITGLTAPAAGETPVAAIDECLQYRGTVAWTGATLLPNGNFNQNTSYTAIVTIIPKTGYTLQGITENFFTVDGSTGVVNDADSGIVTVTFADTDAFTAQGIQITLVGFTDEGVGTIEINTSDGIGGKYPNMANKFTVSSAGSTGVDTSATGSIRTTIAQTTSGVYRATVGTVVASGEIWLLFEYTAGSFLSASTEVLESISGTLAFSVTGAGVISATGITGTLNPNWQGAGFNGDSVDATNNTLPAAKYKLGEVIVAKVESDAAWGRKVGSISGVYKVNVGSAGTSGGGSAGTLTITPAPYYGTENTEVSIGITNWTGIGSATTVPVTEDNPILSASTTTIYKIKANDVDTGPGAEAGTITVIFTWHDE